MTRTPLHRAVTINSCFCASAISRLFFLLRASCLKPRARNPPFAAAAGRSTTQLQVVLGFFVVATPRAHQTTIPKTPTSIPWFLPTAEPRLPARHVGPQQSLCEERLALALAGARGARQAKINPLRAGALSSRALSHGRPEPAIPLPKPLPCLAQRRPWADAATAATAATI
jgi:hypothetical protein